MGKNLITKQEYKSYAGITSPTHDAEIDLLIPKVSQLVKTYCRGSLVDNVDDPKLELSSGGFQQIYLREHPVIQVLSVEKSVDYGKTYTELLEFVDWAYDPSELAIVSIIPGGFEPLVNGYRVLYTCGYEAVPDDLKLAVLDLVTYYRKNDGAIHSSKAPGTNSVQIEYVTTTSLPAHIRRVLDQYVMSYA